MAGSFDNLSREVAGNDNLIKAGTKINSELASEARELDRLNRALISEQTRVFRGPEEELNSRQTVGFLMEQIKEKTSSINYLNKHRDMLIELQNMIRKKGPQEALGYVESKANIGAEYPEIHQFVSGWAADTSKVLQKWHQNYKLISSNLDNASKFVSEIKLYSKRDPEFLKKFLENPENKAMVTSLSLSGPRSLRKAISQILSPSKETTRPGIVEWFKRVGIGVGSAITGAIGIAIYNWFNSNPPDKTSNMADSLSNNLKNLKATGQGATIVSNINASLARISQIADKTNVDLGEDPEKAASLYVSQLTKELNNISSLLTQWQTVVINSSDKNLANTTGQQLMNFVKHFTNSLKSLGNQLGIVVK